MIDIGVALCTLILLAPVLAGCWLFVRLSSKGPALFRQYRMGRDGREFVLLKFRTMYCTQARGRAGHTVVGDRRITRAGAVLRRYKLDELPQFWNVLKGDMSLVGPRPKLPEHEGLLMPCRPGITGKATLAFRNEECMLRGIRSGQVEEFYQLVVKPIKRQLDMEYMATATPGSDFKLLWQTLRRCVTCAGDGRQELLELMERHAPEHIHLLKGGWGLVTTQLRKSPAPVPGMADELVGDLNDAA